MREEAGKDETEAAVGARLYLFLARKVLVKLAGRHLPRAAARLGALNSLISNAKSIGDQGKVIRSRRPRSLCASRASSVSRHTAAARSKLSPSRRRSTIHASSDRAAPMASSSSSLACSLRAANSGAKASRVASRSSRLDDLGALGQGRMVDELAGCDAQRHDLVEHLGQVLDHRGDADDHAAGCWASAAARPGRHARCPRQLRKVTQRRQNAGRPTGPRRRPAWPPPRRWAPCWSRKSSPWQRQ